MRTVRPLGSALLGLMHVRSLHLATLVTLVLLMLVWSLPELAVPIQLTVAEPVRGVGTIEIGAVILSPLLAVLTVPRFDARERLAYGHARLGHTLTTLAVALTPLLVLPVWTAAIDSRMPGAYHPPTVSLTGNLLTAGTVSVMAVLLLGRATGAVLAVLTMAAIVAGQQLWPHSPLTALWATGTQWHTNWLLAAALVATTLFIAHRLHSVPRR